MRKVIFSLLIIVSGFLLAVEKVHYSGQILSNPDYHHGQLQPVIGVHNIQVMRANREHPDANSCLNWTYNHQPMLAYRQGKFYLQYLSDSVGEHIPPSKTFLQTSVDGYHWTSPVELFPLYKVPDGFTKPEYPGVAKNLTAIMHQRVGFYVSKSGRLITMANYGVALDSKDDPNDGNGIGRVVREIYSDGTFGPVYFIYYNHAFNQGNTDFPHFSNSKDKAFVQACREILDNPLYRMQWVEEADRDDKLIPLNKPYKAFCYYTLADGKKVALWKHALTSVSEDGGNTWAEPVERAKGFVNSNAKIWGQKLSDRTYATVYNPSEFRWPLAVSTSADGLNYTTLNLIHGEITPMRYGGNYKSYGPQYVRGIQEGNGTPPDGKMWVAYSMNKEDMWVSSVPVPVKTVATTHADEDFRGMKKLSDLSGWNIYAPLMAPVSLAEFAGKSWLTFSDRDPFDYAKAEKIIPATSELKVNFKIRAEQNNRGIFRIDFADARGQVCSRVELTAEGIMRAKGGARFGNLQTYDAGKIYQIEAQLSVTNRSINIFVDGKKAGTRMFFAPVENISRIIFYTGETRTFPNPDTPADQDFDLPDAGEAAPFCIFRITDFKTSEIENKLTSAVLKYKDFAHYADYFNSMEDENIVQLIPNAESSAWMEANIPLFNCPQKNFEEMFYYRWWTLRKHIKETPAGYGMTEFLVNRSYADKYNLISCALGHHIYESRWLRNQKYLNQSIHTWYRGNEGKPMAKMMNFSSWAPDAVFNRFKVNVDKDYLLNLLPDLIAEYTRWENTHRLSGGLYWQGDVQDGMEETISGGRRKKYARPTINSYMYGDAVAIAEIAKIAGNEVVASQFNIKADSLKTLVQNKLWNANHQFFETSRIDSLANVREAIGFIPWYFNLPDKQRYDSAWVQLMDEKGMLAPYGQTTAERRHPSFRTRGVGKCEWDGAVWPFATSQTLTGLANFLNSNPDNKVISRNDYFRHLELLVESQYHRGRPYVGEYLDEVTGYWLKGDQERSRYYNHSTFNDLIITGLIGLRPRTDNVLEINPLIPEGKWDWFCLDNILYHGKNITILWDKTGEKYHLGKGFQVLVNGVEVAKAEKLGRIELRF
jgi:hypothetical protein